MINEEKLKKAVEHFIQMYTGKDKSYITDVKDMEILGTLSSMSEILYNDLQEVIRKEFILYLLLLGYNMKDYFTKYNLNELLNGVD